MNKATLLNAAAALLACAQFAPAYASFQALRHTDRSAIEIDGKLDEASWQRAQPLDTFYEFTPQDRIPAKLRTEIRVLYDDAHLYVGMTAWDSSPDAIRAPFSRRDKTLGDQDLVALFLDPTGTRKAAQFIRVNARGSVSDGSYTDQAGEDFSPDFPFDAATGRFPGGWTAEIRIPYSSLAYADPQANPWNLLVMRNLLRDHRYRLASGPIPKGSNCLLCYAQPINGMQAIPVERAWSLMPQLVARRADDGQGRREASLDPSLDFRMQAAKGTVVAATLNPDFSQVELDAPQLSGNTAFSLFAPEKRPFFLESADLLAMPMRAVHTRSMTDPAWGARVTRRTGSADTLLLTTRDAGGGLVQLPGPYGTAYAPQDFRSQATIARGNLRYQNATVGALLSDRTLADGRGYNRVLGPDFMWQRGDQLRLSGQLLASDTTALPDASGRLTRQEAQRGHAAYLTGTWQSDRWYANAELRDVSEDFRAYNGFFAQAGFSEQTLEVRRKFGTQGIFNTFNAYAVALNRTDKQGDTILRAGMLGLYLLGPLDSIINLEWLPDDEVRTAPGGPTYSRNYLYGRVEASPGPAWARVLAEVRHGTEVDIIGERTGRGTTATLSARIRPSDRFEFEPLYSTSWIKGLGEHDGARLYSERVIGLNGIYHFSARDTLRLNWQQATTRRDPARYAVPVEAERRHSAGSLVYAHERRLGTAIHVGVTLAGDAWRRQRELFVKGSWLI